MRNVGSFICHLPCMLFQRCAQLKYLAYLASSASGIDSVLLLVGVSAYVVSVPCVKASSAMTAHLVMFAPSNGDCSGSVVGAEAGRSMLAWST